MEPDPGKRTSDIESPMMLGAERMSVIDLPATLHSRSSSAATTFQLPVDMTRSTLPGHDSMETVRLSEPQLVAIEADSPPGMHVSKRSAAESTQLSTLMQEKKTATTAVTTETTAPRPVLKKSLSEELAEMGEKDDVLGELSPSLTTGVNSESEFSPVHETEIEEEVNWIDLEKDEDQEAQESSQDDNSTAMLLARLEQENNKIATNPKSVKVHVTEQQSNRRPRPPSMAQLRDMVHAPTPGTLRYSVLPPPPMTELEFYMALVKDYQQTAARLPTLLSKKIRQGIPPPLRGVVWQSMSSARDVDLLEHFDRLSGESSPYEGIIGKDLGRSFPGVDMFRDPDGEGQKMLGRVLKCFSLYDQKIGYCQGLGFLVGPLLMHMPDNLAFCVLVRLMENYDLRACFLPDLSGLHVRIYQFRELLRQLLPRVSAHLDELQVDPTYVSQWFLSFFAVTCPLPMLFRIYDVIFAEGASETIMRAALSLMRKNEKRILACVELEDVMQLLLSRGLWDCYHYNADEFVDDFISLSHVVTRENLGQLKNDFQDSQAVTANATRTSDVATAAARFLGRLWNTNSSSSSSTRSISSTLSPGSTAPSRPLSMLRRTASKQSLASTLNSMETSSASVTSSVSTDATTISRTSSQADEASFRESTPLASRQNALTTSHATESRALHNQIEDLLTALSESQRNHALLVGKMQREREERDEERQAIKSILDGLKNGQADRAGTPSACLSSLIESVERYGTGRSGTDSGQETKSQLRDELVRVREHLKAETAKCQSLNKRIDELSQEAQRLKDELRDSRAHARSLHSDRQRLEKQVHTMRVRASADPQSTGESGGWFLSTLSSGGGGGGGGGATASVAGLRELKLGRSKSTPIAQPVFSKRSSSLVHSQTHQEQGSEMETILLELAQAKTAEAMARQEADEVRQKLESLKRAIGVSLGESQSSGASTGNSATLSGLGLGVFSRLGGTSGAADSGGGAAAKRTATFPMSAPVPALASSSASAPLTNSGGFWGWRR